MSSEDEYVRLVGDFQRLGYHVARRAAGGLDTIVVAGKPEMASGITLYQRSVHLHQSCESQWHTSVGGITLPWAQSLETLIVFVSNVMESEDAAYLSEQQRRVSSVGGGA